MVSANDVFANCWQLLRSFLLDKAITTYTLTLFIVWGYQRFIELVSPETQPSRNVDCQNMIDHNKNMFNYGFLIMIKHALMMLLTMFDHG